MESVQLEFEVLRDGQAPNTSRITVRSDQSLVVGRTEGADVPFPSDLLMSSHFFD